MQQQRAAYLTMLPKVRQWKPQLHAPVRPAYLTNLPSISLTSFTIAKESYTDGLTPEKIAAAQMQFNFISELADSMRIQTTIRTSAKDNAARPYTDDYLDSTVTTPVRRSQQINHRKSSLTSMPTPPRGQSLDPFPEE